MKFAILGMFLMFTNAHAAMKGSIDFKTLQLPSSPNTYLVCPKDFCAAQPHEYSQTYRVSARELYQVWAKMIKHQQRVTLNHIDESLNQYQYIQRSKIFRFPDYINVQFIPLNEKTSTLAIYSRSKYGYSDLGVNRERIQAWLASLQKYIKPKTKK